MTGAEMERAIEFILQSRAHLEAQIAETNRVVQLNAGTQTGFIQIVTRHIEVQGEINASLRASVRELTSAQLRTGERADKTDERLDRIADMIERHIVEGHGTS